MKPRLVLSLFVLAACAAGQASPHVQRAVIAPVERSFDARISRFNIDDPIVVLGASRGVYLEGFGLLLGTEVDLLPGANITPFRPAFTKEEKIKIRAKKLERLAKMKELMRDMLVDAAGMLDTVPADEQIAVAVSFLNRSWEDTTGLPAQIVIQAPRKSLVEYKTSASKTRLESLNAILKVREY